MKLQGNKSIKVRITMWYALFVVLMFVLMMGVLMVSQHISSRGFYHDRLKRAVDETTLLLQRMEDIENIDTPTSTGVHISFLDDSGELLRGSKSFSAPFNEKNMRVRTGANESYWYIQDAHHVLQDGNTIWLRCYISSSLSERNNFVLLVSMMIIMLLLIIVIIFGGYLLTKRAFHPLDEIIEIAEGISDTNDLQQRFRLPGQRDEVGRLADTFDKMLARIEKSVQNEKAFISDASHELRTPISVIRAQSEFALGENRNTEEKDAALEVIQDRSRKAGEMLSQMLLLSRMDYQKLPVTFERICISDLLERLAQEAMVQADFRQIKIICEIEPEIMIYCDELLMMRAITNLIDNAVRYGNDNGHVWIHLAKKNKCVELVIRDDGIGIAEEDKERVWKRFYQVKKSSNSSAGSGLGLSIVEWIIRTHHGTITLQSTFGIGTEFVIQLPETQEP